MQLPALKALMVTGDLDPRRDPRRHGRRGRRGPAQKLADVVRGFVALASLQAIQKPELSGPANAISVTTEQSSVHVSARVPYEVLDALQPKKAAGVDAAAPAR